MTVTFSHSGELKFGVGVSIVTKEVVLSNCTAVAKSYIVLATYIHFVCNNENRSSRRSQKVPKVFMTVPRKRDPRELHQNDH